MHAQRERGVLRACSAEQRIKQTEKKAKGVAVFIAPKVPLQKLFILIFSSFYSHWAGPKGKSEKGLSYRGFELSRVKLVRKLPGRESKKVRVWSY